MLQRYVCWALVGLLLPLTTAIPNRSPSGVWSTPSVPGPSTASAPAPVASAPVASGNGNKLVFCHFMMGVVNNRQSASDYDDDMKRAKAVGIDAFALNIGTDSYADTQLNYAYESAANNAMKVFISFDFNWYKPGQGSDVGNKIKQYANRPSQLKVEGKTFVSSFAGDGVDVGTIKSTAGPDIFFAPNFHPDQGDFGNIDGALNWMAWDNNGGNKAPTPGHNVSVSEGDNSYTNALAGKDYIAPVSPWFSTHFGKEVSYSKNWVFPSDLLWYNRWRNILDLSPRFVEIITWNDYGESHYIGPLSSPHSDDGASKWVMDMPHTGWLEMSKPFIKAYKAGAPSADHYVTEDKLVYWYRPTPKNAKCNTGDTTPDGTDTMQDAVFVVSLLKSPATITVQSGSQQPQLLKAPAGIHASSVPMGIGKQTFSVKRDDQTVFSGTSLKDIVDTCVCGIYNFNAYVGTLPAESNVDRLQPDGLSMLSQGLKVPACPTNTLGAVGGATGVASRVPATNTPVGTPVNNPASSPVSNFRRRVAV
ncbi:alpha-1,3-glucanase/mutanase [Penicillium alfredii]|uniref:Alpha-1,3-glucanase/mutanase n=1 Tax=Penicillium alfredii TaxID=1506179 RepID=A0A9W9F924_9EURO|nr:alpha-1,3-glucanase/mutanase [Penicillium alfredii]KAJ5095816.1 alpha-1,3-glucanase/mutanase [Penicillium alfredii]